MAELVTGIGISREVLPALTIRHGSATVRPVHSLIAYWGFLVMAVHVGLHMQGLRSKLEARLGNHVWAAFLAVLVVLGVLSFFGLRFPEFLVPSGRAAFLGNTTPLALHLLMLVLLFAAVAAIAQAVALLLRKRVRERR